VQERSLLKTGLYDLAAFAINPFQMGCKLRYTVHKTPGKVRKYEVWIRCKMKWNKFFRKRKSMVIYGLFEAFYGLFSGILRTFKGHFMDCMTFNKTKYYQQHKD
jgi:hypothetical protein